MATKLDTRQSVNRSALAFIGSAANDSLDTILPKINNELAKLFEDRNLLLVSDGTVTVPSAGTSFTLSSNLRLHINSQVVGGSPTVIDLASTTRTLSANLKMVYAVIDRIGGTATVTDDSSTLPAVTSSNQEVVLIAKRVDATDGTKRVYFRNGFTLSAGQTARFGQGGTVFANEFVIADSTDTTKKLVFQASGSSTATTLTFTSAQSTTQSLAIPNVSSGDSLVTNNTTAAITQKSMAYSVSTDSTTTSGNASLQAFTTGVVRLTNASLTSVSGIPAGTSGQILIVENKTGNQIIVNNEETTPTAANRIQTGSNSNVSMLNNATFAFTYDTTSARWQLTGGSGSGSGSGGSGKNYLSAVTTSQSTTPNTGNGDFELGSTTGWSLFNTTLTSLIPTGAISAGASSIGTFGTFTSGRLAGNYSLQVAAGTAWSAGQGFISDAFNHDKEDIAKVLTFKFAYSVNSGAPNSNFSGTSSNTLAVYIYDVNASAWIQPTGVYGMTQNSGTGICTGTFQTTSSQNTYRIAVIAVNASSGPLTMFFDDFFIGPQTSPIGAAITDWQSYTPVFQGFGTPSSVAFQWRRVGDSVEIQGDFASGTATAVEARIGLPPGLTSADTSRIPFIMLVSYVALGSTGTSQYQTYIEPNVTYITMGQQNGTNSGLTKQNGNQILGSGNIVSFKALVPIAGWSSNVQMSSDTDTRVVAARFNNTSQTVGTSPVTLIYTSVDFDTHGAYSTSTGLYTVPIAGKYRVSAFIIGSSVAQTIGTSAAELSVLKNGGSNSIIAETFAAASATYRGGAQGSSLYDCKAGDTLEIRFKQGASAALDQTTLIWGSVERLTGPSVIAASEIVAASYYLSANMSIGTTTPINYDTKIFDTHSAVTTGAAWKFTAPVSGIYQIELPVLDNNAAAINFIALFKNGVVNIDRMSFTFGNENGYGFGGSTLVQLNAGDYIDLRANATFTVRGGVLTGASFAGANTARIHIFKVTR